VKVYYAFVGILKSILKAFLKNRKRGNLKNNFRSFLIIINYNNNFMFSSSFLLLVFCTFFLVMYCKKTSNAIK